MSAASLKRNRFVRKAVTQFMGLGGRTGVDDGEGAAVEAVTDAGEFEAWAGVLSHVAMKGPRCGSGEGETSERVGKESIVMEGRYRTGKGLLRRKEETWGVSVIRKRCAGS